MAHIIWVSYGKFMRQTKIRIMMIESYGLKFKLKTKLYPNLFLFSVSAVLFLSSIVFELLYNFREMSLAAKMTKRHKGKPTPVNGPRSIVQF